MHPSLLSQAQLSREGEFYLGKDRISELNRCSPSDNV